MTVSAHNLTLGNLREERNARNLVEVLRNAERLGTANMVKVHAKGREGSATISAWARFSGNNDFGLYPDTSLFWFAIARSFSTFPTAFRTIQASRIGGAERSKTVWTDRQGIAPFLAVRSVADVILARKGSFGVASAPPEGATA